MKMFVLYYSPVYQGDWGRYYVDESTKHLVCVYDSEILLRDRVQDDIANALGAVHFYSQLDFATQHYHSSFPRRDSFQYGNDDYVWYHEALDLVSDRTFLEALAESKKDV